MIKGISAEVALSELPEGSKVWIVTKSGEENVVLVPTAPTGEPVLLMFLKQEDVAHLARLLSKETPGLKDTPLDIVEVGFHDVLERAIEDNQLIALLGPNEAMKFFKEYQEWLPLYYH